MKRLLSILFLSIFIIFFCGGLSMAGDDESPPVLFPVWHPDGSGNYIIDVDHDGTAEVTIDADGLITPASGVSTSGTITGLVAVTSQSAEYTMTTDMQNGGIVLMTVAADVNLLEAAAGNSFKVIVRDASETVSIRPYAGDTLVYPGISPVLDASDELDSPGGAQDELVCQCIVANTWYCNGTSGWTDGGAGD